MSSVINVVLPVFALILLGYLCRRSGRMGPTGASELNRFVVWLGLPALLFSVVATSTWEQLWQPGFIAAFAIGCLGVFAFTLAYRLLQKQPLVDASLDALGASYANTGYVGIPLCMLVLGDEALQPAMVASIIVVCVLFAIALACVETGLHAGQGLLRAQRSAQVGGLDAADEADHLDHERVDEGGPEAPRDQGQHGAHQERAAEVDAGQRLLELGGAGDGVADQQDQGGGDADHQGGQGQQGRKAFEGAHGACLRSRG